MCFLKSLWINLIAQSCTIRARKALKYTAYDINSSNLKNIISFLISSVIDQHEQTTDCNPGKSTFQSSLKTRKFPPIIFLIKILFWQTELTEGWQQKQGLYQAMLINSFLGAHVDEDYLRPHHLFYRHAIKRTNDMKLNSV